MRPAQLVALAVGGAAGASLRWGITETLPEATLGWGVLTANTLGSFLIGIVMVQALHPGRRDHPLVALGGAGFCGSLTTFSTLAVTVAGDLRDERPGDGLAVLVVSLSLGLLAAWAGWQVAVAHRQRGGRGRLESW